MSNVIYRVPPFDSLLPFYASDKTSYRAVESPVAENRMSNISPGLGWWFVEKVHDDLIIEDRVVH